MCALQSGKKKPVKTACSFGKAEIIISSSVTRGFVNKVHYIKCWKQDLTCLEPFFR